MGPLYEKIEKKLSRRKPNHLPTQQALHHLEAMESWFDKVEGLFEKTGLRAMSDDEIKEFGIATKQDFV